MDAANLINCIDKRHSHDHGAAWHRPEARQEQDEYIISKRSAVSAGGVLMMASFRNGQSRRLF